MKKYYMIAINNMDAMNNLGIKDYYQMKKYYLMAIDNNNKAMIKLFIIIT